MQVANDSSTAIEFLWGSIVSHIWVSERAGLNVLDVCAEVECLVLFEVRVVLRVGNDGGDHVGASGDLSHHNAIARTLLLLKTVGQCLAGTEVNEVGGITRTCEYLDHDKRHPHVRIRSGLSRC